MASLNYTSFFEDLARGSIDMDTDSFKMMLVTSTYTPGKSTHLKRSDVTNEVVGVGYTAGGSATTCTVAKNTGTHVVTFTFSSVSWPTATITARAGVIYKSRGGAATADELVCYVDFLGDVTSTAGTFQALTSSPLTIQN